jgi:hypothetical protein
MSLITNSVFRDTSPNSVSVIPFGQPVQSSVSPYSYENWSVRFNKNTLPIFVKQRNEDFNFRGNDFTIETWVNVDAYNTVNSQTGDTTGYCIFSSYDKQTNNGLYITLKLNEGNNIIGPQTVVSLFYNNEITVTGVIPEAITTNWFHIAVTRKDGVQFIVHINGKKIADTYKSVDITCNTTPTIGGFNFTDSVYPVSYVGYMSSFRISKVARYTDTNFNVSSSNFISDINTTLLLFQGPIFRDHSKITGTSNTLQQGNKVPLTFNTTLSVQGTQLTPYAPYQPTRNYVPSIHGGSVMLESSSCLIAQTSNFNFGVSSWSIDMWINPYGLTNSNSVQTLFTTYGGDGNNTPGITIGLQKDTNTDKNFITFEYQGINTELYSKMFALDGFDYNDNTWSQLCVIYKNNVIDHGPGTYSPGDTVLMMYLNGVPLMSPSTDFNYNVVNSYYSVIGARFENTNYTNFFKGYIANVRVSNAAIKNNIICNSSTNWLQSYTPQLTSSPITQNTSLFLNFDNIQAYDKSAKNDIKIYGTVEDSSSIKKFQTNSYRFTGSSSFITVTPFDVNELTFNGDFTIETWLQWEEINNIKETGIFQTSYTSTGYSSDFNTGVSLSISPTLGTYIIRMCNSTYTGHNVITPVNAANVVCTWQHVAVVRRNGQILFFLNGSQKLTTDVLYKHPVIATSLSIGTYKNTTDSFKGYIDNFRITKDFARYTNTFIPPTQQFSFT